MDRGSARRDGPLLLVAGGEACGCVMFRLPNTGNGSHLSDYSPVAALNGSASPGLGWIENEIGSRGLAEPPGGPRWNGAGGRWRLWPLRLLLWAPLVILAFRGVT